MSLTFKVGIVRSAIMDGPYRYLLMRRWGSGDPVLWVMLNPSTADDAADDPTIRKCMGFASRWGFCAIEVVNLFAWRATKPDALLAAMCAGENVIGPQNDHHIQTAAERAGLIVVAWGEAGGTWEGFERGPRWARVLRLLTNAPAIARGLPGRPVHALRLTKDGHPWHPLYVPYGPYIPFEGAVQKARP